MTQKSNSSHSRQRSIRGLAKINEHALQQLNAKYATGYRFIDKDLICDQLTELMDKTGATPSKIARGGNIAANTVRAIKKGKTKRPQNRTVEAILRSMGLTREIVRFKIGVAS